MTAHRSPAAKLGAFSLSEAGRPRGAVDDLTAVDPELIATLEVLATVVGGEVRHDVGLG